MKLTGFDIAFGSYPNPNKAKVINAFSYHFAAEFVSIIACELIFSQNAFLLAYPPRK